MWQTCGTGCGVHNARSSGVPAEEAQACPIARFLTAALLCRLYHLGYFYFPLTFLCRGGSNATFKFLLPIL